MTKADECVNMLVIQLQKDDFSLLSPRATRNSTGLRIKILAAKSQTISIPH